MQRVCVSITWNEHVCDPCHIVCIVPVVHVIRAFMYVLPPSMSHVMCQLSYRQGMNELLAMILIALRRDVATVKGIIMAPEMHTIVEIRQMEGDAYTLFEGEQWDAPGACAVCALLYVLTLACITS